MNELNIFDSSIVKIDLSDFIFSIIISAILSIFVQMFYMKYGKSFSEKFNFSKNFVILGITITIVITVIKSSLALSLGLVGALSIVRFRAAIKEPEELVYLFLLIGIGLGCGAGQFLIISIGVIIILTLIYFYSRLKFKNDVRNLEKLNLSVLYQYKTTDKDIEKLKNLIIENSKYVKLISLSKTETDTTVNFQIQIDEFKKFNRMIHVIQDKKTKVFISEDNILTT